MMKYVILFMLPNKQKNVKDVEYSHFSLMTEVCLHFSVVSDISALYNYYVNKCDMAIN